MRLIGFDIESFITLPSQLQIQAFNPTTSLLADAMGLNATLGTRIDKVIGHVHLVHRTPADYLDASLHYWRIIEKEDTGELVCHLCL